MAKRDSLNSQQKAEGALYYRKAIFSATPKIEHELYGYKFAAFSRDLQETAIDVKGTIAAVLRYERRENRRAIANRIFYGSASHGILLKAHFKSFPIRSKTIFNIPLAIESPGYDSRSLLIGICDFLAWQCSQVDSNQALHLAEILTFPEIEVLRSNQTVVIMYWLSAILSKYCDLIGANR